MAVFKFVIANPKTRKTYQTEVDQDKAVGLVGKKIGEKFNADFIGLSGYELQITGGTDKDGFPMHRRVHGSGRKRLVLSHPPCFHPEVKGQRKRKTVRGNTISTNIIQVNCKVVKQGGKSLEELIGKKEEKPEEAKDKAEEKPKAKPEKKEESKKSKDKKKSEKPKDKPKKVKKSEKPKKSKKEK